MIIIIKAASHFIGCTFTKVNRNYLMSMDIYIIDGLSRNVKFKLPTKKLTFNINVGFFTVDSLYDSLFGIQRNSTIQVFKVFYYNCYIMH